MDPLKWILLPAFVVFATLLLSDLLRSFFSRLRRSLRDRQTMTIQSDADTIAFFEEFRVKDRDNHAD